MIAAVIKEGRVLLVRRANPPDAGLWGFPGGKIDFGEDIGQAAIRELYEETGIRAEAGPVLTALDAFDRAAGGGLREHYLLIAVLCRWTAGDPSAGDDALAAAWHAVDGLETAGLAMSLDVPEIARLARRRSGEPPGMPPV